MNRNELLQILSGEIVDEDAELSFAELCRSCQLSAARVTELVEYGIIEPLGPEPGHWRFRATSLRRVRSVERLERDLGVNTAGAALALDLLEELAELRMRLAGIDSRG